LTRNWKAVLLSKKPIKTIGEIGGIKIGKFNLLRQCGYYKSEP